MKVVQYYLVRADEDGNVECPCDTDGLIGW
jgi:hypothetical protein